MISRPTRNLLLAALFVVAAFVAAPRLSDQVLWTITALFAPVLVLVTWVAAPFRRARKAFRRHHYEPAALELQDFERALLEAPWKRAFASLAVGLYTSNALAASRNLLGAVRMEQGQLDEAEAHFKKALEHDAAYAVPWGNLAVLAATRGDAAGAESARQKAVELGFKSKLLAAVIKDKLK